MEQKYIRNFSIIAHIDHGKSTLADRIIEHCNLVDPRNKMDQMLDTMDIERERGITIKSTAITLNYTANDGSIYTFNLIDTPGHVDFTYEVSRALAACEGVLLVVDASQGVEAQTIANMYLALENDLEIIPVINKIDMPTADIERTRHSIYTSLGLDPDIAVPVSAAKEQISACCWKKSSNSYRTAGRIDEALKALIFDSYFDKYVGTVTKVRLYDGTLKRGDEIKMLSTASPTKSTTSAFSLTPQKTEKLMPGQVGYVVANIKSVTDTKSATP
jgi:GTP-binding protein LepA